MFKYKPKKRNINCRDFILVEPKKQKQEDTPKYQYIKYNIALVKNLH